MDAINTAKKKFIENAEYNDEKIDAFSENYDKWIANFSCEEREIVDLLLTHFDYYSHEKTNEQLKHLHEKMITEYGVPDEDAAHLFIKKKSGKHNSSIEYYSDYKFMNNINKGYCIEDIRQIEKWQWDQIENIVIIDDCCGTGGSLGKYLEYIDRDFTGKKIFYLVIHALRESRENIKEIEEKFNTKVILVAANIRGKAFELDEIEDKEKAKDAICEFSRDKGLNEKYWLGERDSQGLFAFYNNTPNNTLGIFWNSTEKYEAIFPRDHAKTPSWAKRPTPKTMKKDKIDRNSRNYNARSGNE